MKKFSSVFTLAFVVQHDKEDASDATYAEVREALQDRLDQLDATNMEMLDIEVFGEPDDTQCNYPFNRGEVYWSIDNSDDGRLVLNVSVWDDVSEEDYTDGAMVYGSSYQAMVMFIEMHIGERFPLVKDTCRAAEWTLQWMSNNGFRMPTEVGDHVFVKDIEFGITEWMNR